MATFITLVSFTEQGIKNIKDTPSRFETFRQMATGLGVTVKEAYWTVGPYDMVVIVEGADENATSVLLKVGSLGNIRTQTLRAFSVEEIKQILDKVT